MKYELGQEVKDIITGFSGIITGRCEYLTGCNHYAIQSRTLKDGKPADYEWLDESRLEPTGESLKNYVSPRTSGPEQNPPSW
ncbi:MAG: hypothetical protein PHX80_03755 [Candidatus Nanoarchaeia archaeon]|nr:hypothetical protein [Candidatus Nanoarchaeia archaeon]